MNTNNNATNSRKNTLSPLLLVLFLSMVLLQLIGCGELDLGNGTGGDNLNQSYSEDTLFDIDVIANSATAPAIPWEGSYGNKWYLNANTVPYFSTNDELCPTLDDLEPYNLIPQCKEGFGVQSVELICNHDAEFYSVTAFNDEEECTDINDSTKCVRNLGTISVYASVSCSPIN